MSASGKYPGLCAALAVFVVTIFLASTCLAEQETVLHSFGNANGMDGISPNGGLIFDAAGNLYSTTLEGRIHGLGTAFQLTP
jgi:hypothetical protein